MKKIGLLTTLLVAGLLLTGCNKTVNVENEQERIFTCGRSVSEHFGISDYSISWDKEEEAGTSFVLNGHVNIGNSIDEEKITKNVQCVVDMVDKSVTILEIDEPVVEEPIVEEAEPSEIEKLKQSFVGNIIDGKVDKESLTLQPSNISFNVEGDDTLYYLNEFGIALVLGEDWKGGKVENAYEGKNLASVWLKKSGNRTYGFFLIDNKYFHTWQENPQPDEELVGENNKYHIVMRTVNNGGKDGSFDLIFYNVE